MMGTGIGAPLVDETLRGLGAEKLAKIREKWAHLHVRRVAFRRSSLESKTAESKRAAAMGVAGRGSLQEIFELTWQITDDKISATRCVGATRACA
jgi:hypothetical protein